MRQGIAIRIIKFNMIKYGRIILTLLLVLFVVVVLISCSSSKTTVHDNKEVRNENVKDIENNENVKDVENRDDLKVKAIERAKLFHKLLDEWKYEEVYKMIDDKSDLKLPNKSESIKNFQAIVATFGKLEKIDLNRDKVVEDRGQLQVRQDFTIKFEKETPSPKRFEVLIWNVYPDGNFKLWKYVGGKE